MFRKSFLAITVLVVCLLVAVMILVGGCGTSISGPTTRMSPQSTGEDVIRFLRQSDSKLSWDVVSYSENGRLVQVWTVADGKLTPVPSDNQAVWNRAEQKVSQLAKPEWHQLCMNNSSSRSQRGQIYLHDTGLTNAEFCEVDQSGIYCNEFTLDRKDGSWQVASHNRGSVPYIHCDQGLNYSAPSTTQVIPTSTPRPPLSLPIPTPRACTKTKDQTDLDSEVRDTVIEYIHEHYLQYAPPIDLAWDESGRAATGIAWAAGRWSISALREANSNRVMVTNYETGFSWQGQVNWILEPCQIISVEQTSITIPIPTPPR